MGKLLITGAVALSAAVFLPGRAFANERGPVKLSDAQLDDVVGGDHGGHGGGDGGLGALLGGGHGSGGGVKVQNIGTQVNFIIRDVTLTFNIGPNSPVNLSTVLQLALLGSPTQIGSSTAFQAH
ncbi:MAG: hypothetical protein ACJ78Y_20710 [Myxococcales bacterium]